MAEIDEVKYVLKGLIDSVTSPRIDSDASQAQSANSNYVPKVRSKGTRKRVFEHREAERAFKRLKNVKRKVQFQGVKVFYFERAQGFSVVPSMGGSCLGMNTSHHFDRNFTIAEHRRHSQRESEQKSLELHMAMRSEVQRRRRIRSMTNTGSHSFIVSSSCSTSFDDFNADEVPEQDDQVQFAEGSDGDEDVKYADFSMGDNDVDDDEVLVTEEECCFQPLGTGARKLLLKASGIPIDTSDKAENDDIRASRATCGCSCPDGKCLPETCQCALDNIKCQIDRQGFPCSCSATSCQNPEGRVEFNEDRVRTHFIQTMMRLKAAKSKGTTYVSSPMHIRFSDDSQTSTSYLSTPPPAIYQEALGNEQNEMDTPERPKKRFPVTPTYASRSRLDLNKNTVPLSCNVSNVHNPSSDTEEGSDTFPTTASLLGPVNGGSLH
ncbi:hypothetical protein QR680_009439 [Steinernema hermaphroditum]|uniref:Cysteine/serine-rich nuclear protein N-terminal domain-containing protein n=1 Tax=Steinernema hermaphroditum TaxID=289476 RepID=A0AA39M9P3_9BILA|nr:hypothetical protein QR680_009439 [Steinernema hermaphroditum]